MGNRNFFNRKLHSLLGVIPLGIFLMQHLFVNSFILRGEESFNQVALFMESLPFRYVLEWVVIFIPILYHGIYGLYIALISKNNLLQYGFFRNVMFVLQRISGVFLLIFIGWHVWETRVQAALGVDVNAQMMVDILSHPLSVAFYILGVVAAAFHFANGMWSFCVTWGITVGPKAQRISTYVWLVLFVILAIGGSAIVIEFASMSS